MPTPLDQSSRPLEIQTPLPVGVLGLRSILVREQLGRLFSIEAEFSSTDPDIKFDDIVGHPVVVRLALPGGGDRFWHAFVARFQYVGTTERFSHYRALLMPWLWALTRSSDCRIFQEQAIPDIVQQVFRDRGSKDFLSSLSGTYPALEYCVQYRETDFNFVSRLLEREGIAYYFKHTKDKGTLVLADEKASYEPAEGYADVLFRPGGGDEVQQEAVKTWVVEHEVQPTQYALTDYNPLRPAESLLRTAQIERGHGINDRQMFDYPGVFSAPAEAERISRLRLEELHVGCEVARATGTVMGLGAGHLFKLKDHPRAEQNAEHLVTSVTLQFDAGEFDTGDATPPRYACEFTAIPSTQAFRPARTTPKPVVHGPQPAVIVGPAGEEIHTDEHGRVKVYFFWHREGKGDDTSSCWVRVAQGWAGKKWGAVFLPRIGHEVLVEFLEGDPDRPIVTGSVYNGANKPPYDLPAEKTKSTLKSLSSKGGGGFNEFRIEDKKGSEEIHLHAEKDFTIKVKNNQITAIGNERHETVEKKVITHFKDEHHLKVTKDEFTLHEADTHAIIKGSRHERVEASDNVTVGADRMSNVKGAENLTVGGDRMTKITGADNLKVTKDLAVETDGKTSFKASDILGKASGAIAFDGGDIHIKGGKTVIIEAGTQLSLKVGGSFIDIGPAGVAIVGPQVKVNSGGSAGSGGGCSPVAPAAPAAPDEPDPKEPAAPPDGQAGEITDFSAAAAVLKFAALAGIPFCEQCPREAPEPDGPPDGPGPDGTPVLESIALLDADDAPAGDVVQWVNLASEDKWVDAAQGVTSKNRLGPKLKFKVTFSLPGAHSFKVRLLPGDDNVVFTDAEKGRNAAYKFQDQEKTYTTDGDGTKVIAPGDFFVPVAGGQEFKLEAEDPATGVIVESGKISTRRLGYLVPILMAGMDAGLATQAGVIAEFTRLGLEWATMATANITAQPNIGSDAESTTFQNNCKTAFNGSTGAAKKPYSLAAAFTQHLAVKNPNVALVLTNWPVGPAASGGLNAPIPVEAAGLRAGDSTVRRRALWRNLVPGESWFVSARYEPDGGGAAVDIPEASLTPTPVNASNPDMCFSVEVDTSALPAGTGTIRLSVNVVDRMRAGLSFSGGNLVCVCLKAWWRDMSADDITRAMIHEIGHQVRMVSDGTGKKPDKVPTHYTARGHVGDHCHNGLALQDSFSAVSTGNICVMFGTITDQTEFCPDCSTAVKKMDLTDGWPPAA